MRVVLFDDEKIWKNFWPLSLTRPLSEIRIGILTNAEKWKIHLECEIKYICATHLQFKFKKNITEENNLFINSSIIPTHDLVTELLQLNEGESLVSGDKMIAYRRKFGVIGQSLEPKPFDKELISISKITDLLSLQSSEITKDYYLLTHGRHSQRVPDAYTTIYGENIFIETGVQIKSAILNAENGPIYIGSNCEIEENAIIRGPFGMLEGSTVGMGAKIRSGVSLGPKCTVSGEIKNTIFQGYTNKGHDGYIGDSIIGEWCNFGASTTSSNLKNNWNSVKLYDNVSGQISDSGLRKIGLIVGEYTMTAIGTLFNTGTVIGLGCSIFDHSFSQKFVPSFSWGNSDIHSLDRLFSTIQHIMHSKDEELSIQDQEILECIYRLELH